MKKENTSLKNYVLEQEEHRKKVVEELGFDPEEDDTSYEDDDDLQGRPKQMKPKREFKGIWIPKEIMYRNDISHLEKWLLAEIDSFEGKLGCFASNGYLAKLISASSVRVSQMISHLKKINLITIKLTYIKGTKGLDKRFIFVNKKEIYK